MLQKAVELKPNEAINWFNLGTQNIELGNLEEALDNFNKAEEIQHNHLHHFQKGNIYFRMKKSK